MKEFLFEELRMLLEVSWLLLLKQEESLQRTKEEEEKRKEVSAKFQVRTISYFFINCFLVYFQKVVWYKLKVNLTCTSNFNKPEKILA